MSQVKKYVKRMLKDAELIYFSRNHGDRICLMLTGDEAAYWVNIIAQDDTEQLIITINDSQIIPEAKRYLASEYMTRINYNLILGCFEMDFNDGTYRFRISVDIEEGRLSTSMVGRMLKTALMTMERHRSGLMKILFENWTPERAYESCRQTKQPQQQAISEDLPDLTDEEREEIDAQIRALFDNSAEKKKDDSEGSTVEGSTVEGSTVEGSTDAKPPVVDKNPSGPNEHPDQD